MKIYRSIQKFEIRQTNQIAASLIVLEKSRFYWRVFVFPFFLYDFIRYRRRLQVLRKNLFFTKKERRLWFDKVRAATKKIRMEEADRLYE